MRKLVRILAITALGCAALPATITSAQEASQAVDADLLEKFDGTWQAEGKAFGAPATSQMVWTKTLGGKFYSLTYTINMQRGDTVQKFEGHGYYRVGNTDGFWADNSGDLHPMVTTYAADQLSSVWGHAGGKQGRSHYMLREDGSVEVADWILTDDGWKEFNRQIFRRVSP